jgi:hypothetical protein
MREGLKKGILPPTSYFAPIWGRERKMHASVIANSLGLAINMLGTFFVWKYSLPVTLEPGGERYRTRSGRDPEGSSDEKLRFRFWNRLGFALLFIGFFLQLTSNFLQQLGH